MRSPHRTYKARIAAQRLNDARLEHGTRGAAAHQAGKDYSDSVRDEIVDRVTMDAADAQTRWNREGTPLWMRVKTMLRGGRRG